MEIPGGGGSNVKPSGMENLVERTLCGGGGGMDIFCNHTMEQKAVITHTPLI